MKVGISAFAWTSRFNHPNFGLPGATVSNPSNFGIITGTTGSARTVSFGAKLMF